MRKTGKTVMIDGEEAFEVEENGKKSYIPCHPDIVYGKTGEWKGWCNWLGNDNFEEVCEGMTPEERSKEADYVIDNRKDK